MNEPIDSQPSQPDARAILEELRTLKSADVAGALPRLRELIDAVETAMPSDRRSRANLAAALTRQAISYLSEGIEAQQNGPAIIRRISLAIQRAEAWVAAPS